jgi:hypothetical protein
LKPMEWTDAARLEVVGVDLHYRRGATGLFRRCGPVLRLTWFGQSRRLLLALHLRRFGLHSLAIPLGWITSPRRPTYHRSRTDPRVCHDPSPR